MPVKKLEDIIGPNGGSKIAESMAVLRGVPVLGIDFQLVRFARILHDCRESLARRQVIIVGCLKEENWGMGISNRTSHERLQGGGVGPALGASGGIDGRAVIRSFRAQHGLNASEGISGHSDMVRLNEALFSQPGKGRQ